jgi:ABC-type phosphate transport system substrate-binding protein
MKSLIFKVGFASAILLLLTSQGATAAEVVIISNSGMSVSADEVRDIFLGEKQFTGSTKLDVIDNAALQGEFLSKVMHMDAAKYHSIWTKKSFRDGLTPPAVKTSDAEVIEYVKRTPGAIGYVSTKPAGVSVVK